jgi:hypothetical protein
MPTTGNVGLLEDAFLDQGLDIAGADQADQGQRAGLADQFAGELDGFRDLVAVVAGDQADLGAMDAACGIDPVEIQLRAGADVAAGRRQRTGIGGNLADHDQGRRTEGRQRSECERERGQGQPPENAGHEVLLCVVCAGPSLLWNAGLYSRFV